MHKAQHRNAESMIRQGQMPPKVKNSPITESINIKIDEIIETISKD